MSLRIIRDGIDPNTIADVAGAVAPRIYGTQMIKHNDAFTYPLTDVLNFEEGFGIPIYDGETWRQILNKDSFTATAASLLDVGSFQVGTDYYIYLCLPGANGQPTLMISANSTWPLGQSANSCRKIGGFHYGIVRCVSSRWVPVDSTGVEFGANGIPWQQNCVVGIIPNSIWDLKNKARVHIPGMAKVGEKWYMIYHASQDESITFEPVSLGHLATGTVKSAYGQIPLTGTEGFSWFAWVEMAQRMGLKLPSYQEFIQYAYGNPGGQDTADDYGWTKTTNTGRARTGASVDPTTGLYSVGGIKKYAVSAFNLADCVGNVYDYLSDIWEANNTTTAYAWDTTANVLGVDKGNVYTNQPNQNPRVGVAGGLCLSGARAGCRTVNLSFRAFIVSTSSGCRFASEAL